MSSLLLLLPYPAASEQTLGDPVIAVHPLVRFERGRERGAWCFQALGPLIEWGRDGERSWFLLRPLLRVERNRRSGDRQFDLLWPLVRRASRVGRRSARAESELRILPFLRFSRYTSPAGRARKSLILFPFIYWGRQEPSGRYFILFPFYWRAERARLGFPIVWNSMRSFYALVPLYGVFYDLWGNDEVRFYGWPFFIRTRRADERGIWVPWPFIKYSRGSRSFAVRLWPIVGVRFEGGRLAKGFLLWPLGHLVRKPDESEHHAMLLPFFWKMRKGRTKIDYYFPLWGRYQSPSRTTTSYLWPLFSHTVDRKQEYSEYRFLWFIGRWRKGTDSSAVQLWPLGGRLVERDRYQGFALWPLIMASVEREPSFQSQRRWSVPLYWFKRRVWHDGSEAASWTLVPFGRYEKARNRIRRLRSLWPIWVGDLEPIETIYAPIWTFFDRRTVPGEFLERRILGRTLYLRRDSEGQTREVNLPFLTWRRTPRADRFVLLGIVRFELSRPHGDR